MAEVARPHYKTERPLLLVVDQAEPHKNKEAIWFCRENIVVVVCLPAHTTHVMQQLDVGVFGPLKRI